MLKKTYSSAFHNLIITVVLKNHSHHGGTGNKLGNLVSDCFIVSLLSDLRTKTGPVIIIDMNQFTARSLTAVHSSIYRQIAALYTQ